MLASLLKGLALDIGAAAPLGPVNVEIARRTLRHGFGAGFALGMGAVTVDVTYALLTSLGVGAIASRPGFLRVIQIAGALLLTWLGIMSLRAALRAAKSPPIDLDARETALSVLPGGYMTAYGTGLLMTFFNPMTILFWFTSVPSAMGPTGGGDSEGRDLPIICAGVFVATITWVVFFASALKWLRQLKLAHPRRRHWFMTAADALGGLVLLGFAGYAFWTSIGRSL